MDYETLNKGRRRNWKKPETTEPAPPEEQEEYFPTDKKEENREYKAYGWKDKIEDEHKEESTRFRRSLAGVRITILATMIFFLGVGAHSMLTEYRSRNAIAKELERLEGFIAKGIRYRDFNNPASAFASWRSIMLEQDTQAMIKFATPARLRAMQIRDRKRLELEYERLKGLGIFNVDTHIAKKFTPVEVIHYPQRPWSRGQLASFAGPEVELPGNNEKARFVISFAYNDVSTRWEIADFRKLEFFSRRWDYESKIAPLKGGANAVRYDDKGNPVQMPGGGF